MEHVGSSRKHEYLIIDPNKDDGHEIPNSSHQEEPPLFLGFPSPFFDDIDTIPILANNHTHQHQRSSPNKCFNITEPTPSESKRLKKRNVGKKDRHSKIHTAQGLRDRRMRLSLHIARKFFDLQDLLGFDKASKTIEWLFCKSNKAIKEVADNFDSKHTNQSMTEVIDRIDWRECEMGLSNEIKVAANKPKNYQEVEIKNKERKRTQNNTSSKDTRDQARARARQRTRERLMIKELEKSKFLFERNPNDEIHKLGLGYMVSSDNQNIDKLGYTSIASEPVQQQSLSPSDFSSPHHLLRELQLANINDDILKSYSGSIVSEPAYCTTLMNHNPPAGWLNSSFGFIGVPGEYDADNIIPESYNQAIVPITDSLTGDHINYEQNPSSFFMSTTNNFHHFQTQNQGK
ncbi:unnamed protein product [Lactuca virosa]|uniref:Uncharacterized protein n=1 Tax=Lactuca virosa TaxID=75947 RepID=A0AAU9MTS0_9ASTR|nr:unnamed protein product [Lactuca virosa]